MTVQEAIKIVVKAHDLGLLDDADMAELRKVLAPKIKCLACRDRGGWEDGDEGQWVLCNCKANRRKA